MTNTAPGSILKVAEFKVTGLHGDDLSSIMANRFIVLMEGTELEGYASSRECMEVWGMIVDRHGDFSGYVSSVRADTIVAEHAAFISDEHELVIIL